jgi:hypothetical protein
MPTNKYPGWIAGAIVWIAGTLLVTYFVMSHSDVTWIQTCITNAVGH